MVTARDALADGGSYDHVSARIASTGMPTRRRTSVTAVTSEGLPQTRASVAAGSTSGLATMSGSSAGFGQQASPLTLGIAAMLVSFYVVNSIGLFVQMGRLAAPPEKPFINP